MRLGLVTAYFTSGRLTEKFLGRRLIAAATVTAGHELLCLSVWGINCMLDYCYLMQSQSLNFHIRKDRYFCILS